MSDLLIGDRTETVTPENYHSHIGQTQTRTIHNLIEEVEHSLSSSIWLTSPNITTTTEQKKQINKSHHHLSRDQLEVEARETAKRPMTETLEKLACYGFAWRDIARMVGVSVPALRRWRNGELPNADHRVAVARLLAFADILCTHYIKEEIASWMEIPLVDEAPLNGIDLISEGKFIDLFDLANGNKKAETILDEWKPSWRDSYKSIVEVFEAVDGELGLRLES